MSSEPESQKLWRLRNKDRISLYGRRWYKRNKKKKNAKHHLWCLKNGKYRAAYLKRWREENAEYFKELQTDWRRRCQKQYYKRNIKKLREANARSYAKGLGLTRSEIMARIKSVSGAEKAARGLVTAIAGCRLVHQPRFIDGKPDYANKSKKVAVFFHGCYWHGCFRHFHCPKTNSEFWQKKIDRNIERHNQVRRKLKRVGWRVLTVWEHELYAK